MATHTDTTPGEGDPDEPNHRGGASARKAGAPDGDGRTPTGNPPDASGPGPDGDGEAPEAARAAAVAARFKDGARPPEPAEPGPDGDGEVPRSKTPGGVGSGVEGDGQLPAAAAREAAVAAKRQLAEAPAAGTATGPEPAPDGTPAGRGPLATRAERRPRRPRRPPLRRGQRGRLASVGLHATLLLAALIAVFPPFWLLVTSFKPKADTFTLSLVSNFSLDNYRHVLSETEFLTWFGNSVLIVVSATVLGVLISATTGYALSRFRFPGMRPLMWTLLITQMFPMAVLIVPLYNLMSRYGVLNQPIALIVTYLTIAVPFCSYMMRGFFDTIPISIDESGRVDGLSPFGTFWRLVMPLARPGLAVTGFFSFVTAWAEVAFATAFMTGEENLTLAGGLQTFVNQHTQDWHLMTAAAVVIAVPAIAVFGYAQRHLQSGLTAGSTKA